MINNIFSALVREKTSGAILEFVLWCTVCFTALMSLIALAMGGGHVVWILLMLFSIGLGVLMAFRLKAIALLYSACIFNLLIFFIHYLCFSLGNSEGVSHSPLNIILFVLVLLLSLAVTACAFVQFFSKFQIGKILTILVLVDSAFIMLLQILMYTSEYMGASYANSYHRTWLNYKGYWIGTISFWIILAVIDVFYVGFFMGPIDSRKDKIYVSGQSAGQRGMPGIQGISGAYAGRTILLRGGMITIGSGNGVSICIPDAYVSQMHCTIRFNSSTGFYEVLDQSSNGVWLTDGTRLQKSVYNSVRRGSILCIGTAAQQFRLL